MTPFTVGLDLGQAADYSALSIVEKETRPDLADAQRTLNHYAVRHLHRWKLGTPYTRIVADVTELTARPPLPGSILTIDATGVGRGIVDQFRAANLQVQMVPITIHGGMDAAPQEGGGWSVPKKDLVAVMQTLIQGQRFKIVPALTDAKILGKELQQFRVKVTIKGNEVFENLRERDHDDMVLSVAMACWFSERGSRVQMHVFDFSEQNLARIEAEAAAAADVVDETGMTRTQRERLPGFKTPEETARLQAWEDLLLQPHPFMLGADSEAHDDPWKDWV